LRGRQCRSPNSAERGQNADQHDTEIERTAPGNTPRYCENQAGVGKRCAVASSWTTP
jgi:hypothetical protein